MAPKSDISKGLKKAQRISNPLTKRLFDLKEAAIYLGRPVYSIRALIWNLVLLFIKEGRKYYLDVYDMDDYIEKNKERVM